MPKILVIEDNRDVRDNVVDILALAGYEGVPAAGGQEGVERAQRGDIDLILCDVMMPKLDGYGVLKILSQREDTCAIPFVFVTAKGEQEDLRRGMNLGADDYVTKPFYKDELLRVIEVRLRKNESRQGPNVAQAPSNWTGFLSQGALQREMDALLADATRRTYRRGEAIYREGERVRDVFLLREGFAKHQKTTEFGKTLIVYVFAPGDLFGYPEMIANDPYEHDTVALSDLSVDFLPVDAVRERLASDPNIADLLLGYLSHGLLDADRRMLYQAYYSVRKRCAKTLLRAHEVFGEEPWPMSREELSQWAGTAKETFIRNLTDFRDSGYVTIESNRIRVTDVAGLQATPG